MVRRYRLTKSDRLLASDAVLALFSITDPTDQQQLGAMFVTDFMSKALQFFNSLLQVKE
jgi:hypothetical protein